VSRSRAFQARPAARSAFALSTTLDIWMTVSAKRPPSAAKAHSPARDPRSRHTGHRPWGGRVACGRPRAP
jgi:hypothetical protein